MPSKALHCEECDNRGHSIFCALGAGHLAELDAAKTTNHYQPHQVIFYEGNQPVGLFCINSGKVKLYKTDPDGHQQIVRLAGAGDVLGYRCLLAGESYAATAETIETADICFIDKRTFARLLEIHPPTAANVMKLLAQDLRRAEEQVANVVNKSIMERLAELFLLLRVRYGEKSREGVKLNLTLTRAEWAEMIGTSQESLIRLFSELRRKKVIAVTGRDVTLCNIPRLTELANLIE